MSATPAVSPLTASRVLETLCRSVTIDSTSGGTVVSPLTTGWGDFSRTREERGSGCVGCRVVMSVQPQKALAANSQLGSGPG